jgi:hypothetical protein
MSEWIAMGCQSCGEGLCDPHVTPTIAPQVCYNSQL